MTTNHSSLAGQWHQMLLGIIQGSYGEPNPLIALRESSLSNRIIGHRRYLPTNRSIGICGDGDDGHGAPEPTLMTNLQTGRLHYSYDSQRHILSKHYDDVPSTKEQQMQIYPSTRILGGSRSKSDGIDNNVNATTAHTMMSDHNDDIVHYDMIEQYPLLGHHDDNRRNSDHPTSRDSELVDPHIKNAMLISDLIESFAEVLYDMGALRSNLYRNIVELPMLVESVQRFYQNAIQLYHSWKPDAHLSGDSEASTGYSDPATTTMTHHHHSTTRAQQAMEQSNDTRLVTSVNKASRRRIMRTVAKALWSDPTIRTRLVDARYKIYWERRLKEKRAQMDQFQSLYDQICMLKKHRDMRLAAPLLLMNTSTEMEESSETANASSVSCAVSPLLDSDPWDTVIPRRNASTVNGYPLTSLELERHLHYLWKQCHSLEQLEHHLQSHSPKGRQLNNYQKVLEHELLVEMYRRTKQNTWTQDSTDFKIFLMNNRVSIREKSIILCIRHLTSKDDDGGDDESNGAHRENFESDRKHMKRTNLKRMLYVYLYRHHVWYLVEYLSSLSDRPFLIPNRTSLENFLIRSESGRRKRQQQRYRRQMWKAVLPDLFS